METDADIARPMLAPLVSACAALGLDAGEPRVLGVGANVVIHLAPSPVVARVATLTAEMRGDPVSYLSRERDICRSLADRGIDVVTPTDLVDPGPHLVDGWAFLLLDHRRLRPVDLDSTADALAAGRSLATLTTALAELPAELCGTDGGQPWAEIETLRRTVGASTDAEAMARIEEAIQRLQATEPDDPWQLVHGDAHRVNVALGEAGIVWLDFEDANRRPLAWDLATLCRAWPAAGAEACRVLGRDPVSVSMRWHHELREVYALLWNLLYAQRYERARPASAERLRGWLAERGLES